MYSELETNHMKKHVQDVIAQCKEEVTRKGCDQEKTHRNLIKCKYREILVWEVAEELYCGHDRPDDIAALKDAYGTGITTLAQEAYKKFMETHPEQQMLS